MEGESISAVMNSEFVFREFLKVDFIINSHIKCFSRDLDEIFSNDVYDTDINGDDDPKS